MTEKKTIERLSGFVKAVFLLSLAALIPLGFRAGSAVRNQGDVRHAGERTSLGNRLLHLRVGCR